MHRFRKNRVNCTLWSWGRNHYGQLGLGDVINRSSPVQVGALTTWTAVFAGQGHSLAIKSDGTLWGWGLNNIGQLGLGGGFAYRSSPVQIGTLTTWTAISCKTNHRTHAIKSDGTLWSWGSNYYGQLGLGDVINRSSPVQVGALTAWTGIAGEWHQSFALKRE